MPGSQNLRICVTCGTQYDVPIHEPLDRCHMCEDPRQFVPPTGHHFTTLSEMKDKYENQILQDEVEKRIWSIWAEPSFAIGQRAVFIETPAGNILWDCVALLDQKTVDFIWSKGGLKAIVLSHPHFWTSHLDWAKEFDCPVYLAKDDKEWLQREDVDGRRRLIEGIVEEIIPGVKAVRLGGHFPGSLILHWNGHIFTADTIAVTLSGFYRRNWSLDANTFFFMWANPNFIPLAPSVLHTIWKRLKPFGFHLIHSLFVGRDVHDPNAKAIMLDDMKLQARHQGWEEPAIYVEKWAYSEEVSSVLAAAVKGHSKLETSI